MLTKATASGQRPLRIVDLTQSYAPTGGGGISTYLREKRDYVISNTPHSLIQIVPGLDDRVRVNGRHVFVEIKAPKVPGSPNYRFILSPKAVRQALAFYLPDVIESLCPWVLPWSAIRHRQLFPNTALVAGYRTDFPNAHVFRVAEPILGRWGAERLRNMSYRYAQQTYLEFDRIYTLSEDAKRKLGSLGVDRIDVLRLGVDPNVFTPLARDLEYRKELNLLTRGPLLVYSGRVDNEKRVDRLIRMFRRLPADLDAAMVIIGDGKLRRRLIAETVGLPIAFVGFEKDRKRLARALASSDIYVSAMADETFGISVLEAQSSGLPVVGVASGAMPERVPLGLGLLSQVDDMDAMASNVVKVWRLGASQIGAAARSHVVRRFGWGWTFDNLLGNIYSKALDRAQTRAHRQGAPYFPTAISASAILTEL